MCGIVGYIGRRDAIDFLIEGLRRLEYRGYDSAGVATASTGGAATSPRVPAGSTLWSKSWPGTPSPGNVGVGHTRWATHGPATDGNAHPHLGGDGAVAVVHNGVIENFRAIKERLQTEGYTFHSATDTEVIAHLIASCLEKETAQADDRRPATAASAGKRPAGNGDLPPAMASRPSDLRAAGPGRQHGAGPAPRNVRPGGPVSRLSRRHHCRPPRQPAGRGRRHRRALDRQRRLALGRPHRPDRLPGRLRIGRRHGRPPAGDRSRAATGQPQRAGARPGRRRRPARRLSALHAQGDLRAARDRFATPCAAV